MPEDLRLLTARRAYEFQPDEIAFAFLLLPQSRAQVQSALGLQMANTGIVAGLFGPVQLGQQGILFQSGSISQDGQTIPIRLLQVEPTRIVIDVAGPSSAIEAVFAQLKEALQGVKTADGHDVIGKVARVRDYSEVSARFGFALADLFPPRVFEAFRLGIGSDDLSPLPTISFEGLPAGQAYGGSLDAEGTTLRFALRSGYKPEDHVYYSSALVGSEAHVVYLRRLEEAVIGRPSVTKAPLPRRRS